MGLSPVNGPRLEFQKSEYVSPFSNARIRWILLYLVVSPIESKHSNDNAANSCYSFE